MRLSEISDYEDQNQNLSWMEVLWKIIWILFERHNKRGYCLKQNSMCCCRAHLNITPCWRRTHLNIWQSSFLSKETIHGTDDWQDPCLWHEKRLVRSKVFNFLGPFGRFVSNFFQADSFSSLWSKYPEMRKFLEWRGRACCLRWKRIFSETEVNWKLFKGNTTPLLSGGRVWTKRCFQGKRKMLLWAGVEWPGLLSQSRD